MSTFSWHFSWSYLSLFYCPCHKTFEKITQWRTDIPGMLFLQIIGVELSDLPNGHESSALVRKLRHMGNKISLKNFASNTQKAAGQNRVKNLGSICCCYTFFWVLYNFDLPNRNYNEGGQKKMILGDFNGHLRATTWGWSPLQKKVLRLLRLAGSNFPNFFRVWQIGQKFWAEIFYMLIFVWSATKNGETFED